MKMLNCGITGGQRDIMLQFLTRMTQVLGDPSLAIRQSNININVSLGVTSLVQGGLRSNMNQHEAAKKLAILILSGIERIKPSEIFGAQFQSSRPSQKVAMQILSSLMGLLRRNGYCS